MTVRLRPRRAAAALATAAALLLAACGDDDDPAAGPSSSGAATSAAADDGTAGGDGGPVTVTDGSGTEVVLDEPARRVVALEWTYAEDLLVLGVEPAGVADVDGYRGWVASPVLPADVADVGTRQEPSLERIAALEPDLIVSATFRHDGIRDQLEAIAPTLLFNPYPDGIDHLEEMRTTFSTLAAAVGRDAQAEAVLGDLDDKIDATAARLEQAGLAGAPVAVAQGALQQGTPVLRLFTANAMVSALLEEAGLTAAWSGPEEQYGFNTVDLEGLTALPDDAHLLTIAQSVSDPFTDAFPGNPVWDNLPVVRAGRVHPMGGDTWTFGGPASAGTFLDRVTTALTG